MYTAKLGDLMSAASSAKLTLFVAAATSAMQALLGAVLSVAKLGTFAAAAPAAQLGDFDAGVCADAGALELLTPKLIEPTGPDDAAAAPDLAAPVRTEPMMTISSGDWPPAAAPARQKLNDPVGPSEAAAGPAVIVGFKAGDMHGDLLPSAAVAVPRLPPTLAGVTPAVAAIVLPKLNSFSGAAEATPDVAALGRALIGVSSNLKRFLGDLLGD